MVPCARHCAPPPAGLSHVCRVLRVLKQDEFLVGVKKSTKDYLTSVRTRRRFVPFDVFAVGCPWASCVCRG
jgi:hypothetical protein